MNLELIKKLELTINEYFIDMNKNLDLKTPA